MPAMLPRNLALIDDDAEYSEYLAQHLRGRGIDVSVYDDSDALLADAEAHRAEVRARVPAPREAVRRRQRIGQTSELVDG